LYRVGVVVATVVVVVVVASFEEVVETVEVDCVHL